jgi:hypothetical protein
MGRSRRDQTTLSQQIRILQTFLLLFTRGDTPKFMVTNEIIASFRTSFWTEEKSSTRRHRLTFANVAIDRVIYALTEEHEDSSFLSRSTCAVLTIISSEYVDPLLGIETRIDEIFITESRNRFSLFVFG